MSIKTLRQFVTEAEKAPLEFMRLWNEVNRLRTLPSRDYITDVEFRNGEWSFEVRYLGDWQVPDDAEDDGDYDWKEPTPATRKKFDEIVKRYPGTSWANQGEKCWVTFFLKALKEDGAAGGVGGAVGGGGIVNAAGTGAIAGLGVNKAGKPSNWGEPGVDLRKKKKKLDEAKTWTNEAGYEEGKCENCGDRCNTHPDASDGLSFCADCGAVTCSCCTKTSLTAPFCAKCQKSPRNDFRIFEDVQPSGTFAGAPVFDVNMDTVMNSRFGKNRYHRYSRYVGEDETGESIRQHGRNRKSGDIILKDSKTCVMTYLRRKPTKPVK